MRYGTTLLSRTCHKVGIKEWDEVLDIARNDARPDINCRRNTWGRLMPPSSKGTKRLSFLVGFLAEPYTNVANARWERWIWTWTQCRIWSTYNSFATRRKIDSSARPELATGSASTWKPIAATYTPTVISDPNWFCGIPKEHWDTSESCQSRRGQR